MTCSLEWKRQSICDDVLHRTFCQQPLVDISFEARWGGVSGWGELKRAENNQKKAKTPLFYPSVFYPNICGKYKKAIKKRRRRRTTHSSCRSTGTKAMTALISSILISSDQRLPICPISERTSMQSLMSYKRLDWITTLRTTYVFSFFSSKSAKSN